MMHHFSFLSYFTIRRKNMYQLPKLSYLFQDLEPYIDTHTMGLHYHKHHQNYLNQLTSVLEKHHFDYRYPLYELIYHINEFPLSSQEDLLFALGGVLNHNLYWKSIGPKMGQKPSGLFQKTLDKTFGSYDQFWDLFKKKALQLKGSGYTFLVLKKNGKLDIINTMNQETPLLFGDVPLFTVDMWEHAYYLNYQNDKSKYLDNFKEIADFKNASEIFNQIMKSI